MKCPVCGSKCEVADIKTKERKQFKRNKKINFIKFISVVLSIIFVPYYAIYVIFLIWGSAKDFVFFKEHWMVTIWFLGLLTIAIFVCGVVLISLILYVGLKYLYIYFMSVGIVKMIQVSDGILVIDEDDNFGILERDYGYIESNFKNHRICYFLSFITEPYYPSGVLEKIDSEVTYKVRRVKNRDRYKYLNEII
jgi:hypothetical protein